MNSKDQIKKELSNLPCPEEDYFGTAGVLLSDEIEHYAKKYQMIMPFDKEHLNPANYELTVGNLYAKGDKIEELHDEPGKKEIRIQPFEVVVIRTHEIINLPRFIIARWNIRVKWAYEGLIWVGGPQVDPGWQGHLPCPIYNLSDKEVTLRLGDPIAVMDFVKTTPFKKGVSVEYSRPPKRTLFEDYNPEKLKSALITEAKERIKDVENKVNTFGRRLDFGIVSGIALITVIVTALSVLVTSGDGVSLPPHPVWTYISVVSAFIALFISIWTINYIKTKLPLVDNVEKRIKSVEIRMTVLAFTTIALIVVIILMAFGKI